MTRARPLARPSEPSSCNEPRASKRACIKAHPRPYKRAGGWIQVQPPLFYNGSYINRLRDVAQERLGALALGMVEDLTRRTLFHDNATVHKDDAVGDVAAKPISCVTTIMVIPSCARSRMTPNTSRTSSGSSADVASSKSITCGFIDRARAWQRAAAGRPRAGSA